MLRKKRAACPSSLRVNGYAPEKHGFEGGFHPFYSPFRVERISKEAIFTSQAAGCSPGKLNGYAPEYVIILC